MGLPATISRYFNSIFKELTGGLSYHNKVQTINSQQFQKLPLLLFTLEGVDGKQVKIQMPPESYAESVGEDRYGFRVYVNEPSGTVLGANFMNNHNLHFDIDKKKLGISESSCVYDSVVTVDVNDRIADEEADMLFDKSGKKKKRIN